MGEVYQAKDRKLGRDVAIKVLPEEFARDADRVARFQREAKLLASLNHPNIAAIYGLEESGGTNFLVLELVEGETLADRIKAGPVPVEEALIVALQIAEALEAAHDKGVIHRDLKPANIKVTPDGKAKVLDFGLAKAFAGDQADLNLSNSPTLSNAATQQGVILGTAAYMSPEQARGRTVDKRTDIWAFGCVLYEMLAGRAAFAGNDVTDILAAVIRAEPDWNCLPANLHWRLKEIVERCLRKDSKDRTHDISDVRLDVQKVLADPSGTSTQRASAAVPTNLQSILPWIAATAILSVIIAGVAVWKLKPPEPRHAVRFAHNLTEDQQFLSPWNHILAVSPDGKEFAYCTNRGLFLRSLGKLEARCISNADEITAMPFFSPDGKWVGYASGTDKKLKKVNINGGAPTALWDVHGSPLGASWDVDDSIVYAEDGCGIMRISTADGTSETLIGAEKEAFYHPRLLPGGKSVLFTLSTNEGYKIAVQSLKSRKRTILFSGDTAWYLPTGHIVYALENSIRAVPFDLDTLQAGTSIPMIDDLYRQYAKYTPQYAVSRSGALVYLPKAIDAAGTGRTLVWVNREGKEEPLNLPPYIYHNLRISPDGTQVALDFDGGGNLNIGTWDLVHGGFTRLTIDASNDVLPIWSPNDPRIFFASQRSAFWDIYSIAADGAGKVEKFDSVPSQSHRMPFSWADDGKTLIIVYTKDNYDIGALSKEGDRNLKPLLNEKCNENFPRISPNGKWLAYASDESGQNEVYVRPYPDVNKRRKKISKDGGDSPLWSPNSPELFYRKGGSVMVVSFKTDPTFDPETAKVLIQGPYVPSKLIGVGSDVNPWDISHDGKRFLMMKEIAPKASTAAGPRKINVVINWFEELKQKVPVK